MSLGHGIKTVTDGLVFYYDRANAKKSWKGKPTTNLNGSQNLGGASGVALTYVGLENGWKKYAMSGTFTSATYPYCMRISHTSFTGGTTYTASLRIKTSASARSKFAQFGTYINFVNQPKNKAGVVEWRKEEDGSYFISRKGFEYTNSTSQPGYLDSRPIQNTTFDPTTDFVYAKEIQVEAGSSVTRYTKNTRSNTDSIKDLIGSNQITAASLSYSEKDNFSFDGVSDGIYIQQPVALQTINDLTFSFWVYPESTGWILCPNSNGIDTYLRYSDSLERFTFVYVESADTNTRSVQQSGCPKNRWYNVTISIYNKTVKMYINGELAAEKTDSIGIGLLTGAWYLGKRPNNTNYFGGRIDSFKVWNRELDPKEVYIDYNSKASYYPGHSPNYPVQSGYQLSQLMPELNSGYYWIKNSKMPSPLQMYVDMEQEGGGYDFYVITNGINPRLVTDPNSGTELGLDLIYPRSKEHWIAAHNFAVTLGGNLNTYFQNMGAVYRTGGIGNYTSYVMRNPDYYDTGAPNWQVPDGGRWWLRDSTYTEPNGDYSAYGFLGERGFPNPYTGQDLTFNDVYATHSAYDSGSYGPGTTYLVSTNAKP